jgi:hypothetical protein
LFEVNINFKHGKLSVNMLLEMQNLTPLLLIIFDIYVFHILTVYVVCLYDQVVTLQYWDIGEPTCICEYCGAMMWSEERMQKGYKAKKPKFAICCSQGRIVIPHYHPLPQPLNDLFHKHDKRSKYFLDNIRSFNSMFAFTSMGGKLNNSINDGKAPPTFVMNGENYHQIGSLLPHPGIQPKFAQLYIYDTENEISNRMSAVRYLYLIHEYDVKIN